MTAALIIAIGLFMVIAGFTGRWRAVLTALVPQFGRVGKVQTVA